MSKKSPKPPEPAKPEANKPESKETPLPENGKGFSLGQLAVASAVVLGLLGAAWLWYWEKPPAIAPRDFATELVIIQLNDTYRLDALSNGDIGGLGRVATLIRQTQQQHKPLIVVHSGDFIAPSLESGFFRGQQMIAALNFLDRLAPVYVVPGNHEFDDNDPSMVADAIRNSSFPWLASNLELTDDKGTAVSLPEQSPCLAGEASDGRVARCAIVPISRGMRVGMFALTLHGGQLGKSGDTDKDGDMDYAKVATTERYQLSSEALAELKSQLPREIFAALGSLRGQQFDSREKFVDALKAKISKNDPEFWKSVEGESFWLSIKDDKDWKAPEPGSGLQDPKEVFLSELASNKEFWSSIADYASQSYVGPAEKAIQQLEAAGADVIIGLTHLDMVDDRQIARLRQSHPRFVWIAGGHEHYAQREGPSPNSALITKGDSNARSVWKISIGFRDNQPQIIEEKIEVNKDTLARDPLYEQQIADEYHNKLKQKMVYLDDFIGNVRDVHEDPVLTRDGQPCFIATEEVVRSQKSDWGSYLADRMRHAYPRNVAQIGFINSGGIRIDDEFCGQVRYEQMERSIGFPTQVIYVKLKGSKIWEILERSVGSKRGDGRFLQMSGIRFEYNRQKPPGWRVSSVQVETGASWQALNTNAEYSVAVSDYLFTGGDGYNFKSAVSSYICPGPDLRALVLEAFKNSKTTKPSVVKEGPFELPAYASPISFAKVEWGDVREGCPR